MSLLVIRADTQNGNAEVDADPLLAELQAVLADRPTDNAHTCNRVKLRRDYQGKQSKSRTLLIYGGTGTKWLPFSLATVKRRDADGFPNTTPLFSHVRSTIRRQNCEASKAIDPVEAKRPIAVSTAAQWSVFK